MIKSVGMVSLEARSDASETKNGGPILGYQTFRTIHKYNKRIKNNRDALNLLLMVVVNIPGMVSSL